MDKMECNLKTFIYFLLFYFFTFNQQLLYNLLVLHVLLLVDNPEKVAVGLTLLGAG